MTALERAIEEISAAIHSSDELDMSGPDDTKQREKIDNLVKRIDRWRSALQAKKLFF